jgi:protocatechuate 3,4-dioxygenase beta subunit
MEARFHTHVEEATPEQALGPFYPVTKPPDQDNDLTTIRGKPGKAKGQEIRVSGRVLNTHGAPVPGATVEIWQANTFGRYTHPQDSNPEPLDPDFQGYGAQVTDASGGYSFATVKPGAYPVGGGRTRPPHIHFMVTGPSSRLVTQMYFEGEPLNDTDPLLNGAEGKERLITTLEPPRAGLEGPPTARFDIVLAQD